MRGEIGEIMGKIRLIIQENNNIDYIVLENLVKIEKTESTGNTGFLKRCVDLLANYLKGPGDQGNAQNTPVLTIFGKYTFSVNGVR